MLWETGGKVLSLHLWESIQMTQASVRVDMKVDCIPAILSSEELKSDGREEEAGEDCSSPPISHLVTCLLLWLSRLWWHWEGVCSPWRHEAGYPSGRHVIMKWIPGGHVNRTQCLSLRQRHTRAKHSNWSAREAHSVKMRSGMLQWFPLNLKNKNWDATQSNI